MDFRLVYALVRLTLEKMLLRITERHFVSAILIRTDKDQPLNFLLIVSRHFLFEAVLRLANGTTLTMSDFQKTLITKMLFAL